MDPAVPPDLEARLDALEQESKDRRAELRQIAAVLPEATSRRALFGAMVADLRAAPDRGMVVKRVVLKVLRWPRDLIRCRRGRR